MELDALPGSAAPQRGELKSAWRSRGYLPHFDAPTAVQHVTYRLADSLPRNVVAELESELASFPVERRDAEKRRRIEAYLDAGFGACTLRQAEAASVVIETWFRFDGERYRLLAFVVMPNHCHALIECFEGWPLGKIVNSWKSYTARWINAQGIGGAARVPFWQREYWDRYIRDDRHFRATKGYIEQNPVVAGLAKAAEEWPWSSAWKG